MEESLSRSLGRVGDDGSLSSCWWKIPMSLLSASSSCSGGSFCPSPFSISGMNSRRVNGVMNCSMSTSGRLGIDEERSFFTSVAMLENMDSVIKIRSSSVANDL